MVTIQRDYNYLIYLLTITYYRYGKQNSNSQRWSNGIRQESQDMTHVLTVLDPRLIKSQINIQKMSGAFYSYSVSLITTWKLGQPARDNLRSRCEFLYLG